MSGMDLANGTVAGFAGPLKSGALSPVELTRATLERIDRVDGPLRGFTTVTGDYALERARAAEEEIRRGQYRGPLHGIPYTLKDLVDTAGIRTTYGYESHKDYVPRTSARVHELMEKAGAILVGKVNCHFRRNVAVTCFNPWDISRSPGHSSAGSGLAVAASMGLVSIGSDTGGSVRIPAAWSGVVGLRATFGIISRHNLFGPSWSFDQAGPLAKTVEDTALALQALAVHDPEDPVSLTGRFPDYRAALEGDIEGVKVGVLEEFVGGGCTEEVERAVRRAVAVLSDMGAEVEEVSIEGAAGVADIHNTIVEPESAVYYRETFSPERLARIDTDMKLRLERGAAIPMADYLDAQRRLALLKRETARVMRQVDVVVSPTSLTTALKVPETRGMTEVRGRRVPAGSLSLACTAIASDVGLPAISVPCGFGEGPLPIGLHIMGRHREEGLVLRVAHAYEQATGWHRFRPSLG